MCEFSVAFLFYKNPVWWYAVPYLRDTFKQMSIQANTTEAFDNE